MTYVEIATRVDYLPPHALQHAVELEREAQATRNSRPHKAVKRDWPMSATGKPIEAPFDFSQIYA